MGQLEPVDRFAAQLEFQPSCVHYWAVPVAVLGCEERGLAEDNGDGSYRAVDAVEGVRLRCFPDLYARLAGSQPDQVMTL